MRRVLALGACVALATFVGWLVAFRGSEIPLVGSEPASAEGAAALPAEVADLRDSRRPIATEPEPDLPLLLQVVDEQGQALPGATLKFEAWTWRDSDEEVEGESVTDSHGLVRVQIPAPAWGDVAASCPGYGSREEFHFDEDDGEWDDEEPEPGAREPVVIELAPAGELVVRVVAPPPMKLAWYQVSVWSDYSERLIDIDPDTGVGRASFGAGSYTAQLYLPWTRGLIGDGVDTRTSREVTVTAGEATEIEIRAAPISWIRGWVVDDGIPVGGARIVATETFDSPGHGTDSFEWIVAPDGSFNIPIWMREEWELKAWRGENAALGPGQKVSTYGEPGERVLTLEIGKASLSGQFDRSSWPATADDEEVVVRVDSLAEAPELRRNYWFQRPEGIARLDARGCFRLIDLPAGTWLLRLVEGDERSLFHRVIEVSDRQHLDLGLIALGPTVDAQLRCETEKYGQLGARLRARHPAVPEGILCDVFKLEGSRLRLKSVQPGEYELDWFSLITDQPYSIGNKQRIRIERDGSVEPSVLRF